MRPAAGFCSGAEKHRWNFDLIASWLILDLTSVKRVRQLCPSSAISMTSNSQIDKSMLINNITSTNPLVHGETKPVMPKSASISTSKKLETDTRH